VRVTENDAFAARLALKLGLADPQLTGERKSHESEIPVIVVVPQLVTVKD
jgi:hypothetical protein